MEHVALFVLGLVLVAAGAVLLVIGAVRLDRALGRSPFPVGIVAVAFGPCVAGLAFELAAVLREPPVTRLAVGHIIGHNIASVTLVFGFAAIVRPVAGSARLFYTAIPLALFAVALFWFLARNSPLSRLDAAFLLAAFVLMLAWLTRAARHESEAVKAEFAGWLPNNLPVWVAVVMVMTALASLAGGAFLTAAKLVGAANELRAPSIILGSTLGAFVTSLPTLIAAAIASWNGRSNLVLGLVVGSILVNILLVAGVTAMAYPLIIDDRAILNAIPVMAASMLLLVPLLLNNLRVPRWEGAVMLAGYVGFLTWQVSLARAAAAVVR